MFYILFSIFASFAIAESQLYQIKFTHKDWIYFAAAQGVIGPGPKESSWLQVLQIHQIRGETSNVLVDAQLSTNTLLKKYGISNNQLENLVLANTVSTTFPNFDDDNLTWQKACVIQVESMIGGTTLGICYELYRTFQYKFSMYGTIYYGTAETVSESRYTYARGSSLCLRPKTIEMMYDVKSESFTASTFTVQKFLQTYKSRMYNISAVSIAQNVSLASTLNSDDIRWEEMCQKDSATVEDNTIIVPYEKCQYFYMRFFLNGATYYCSGIDVSRRNSNKKLLKILNVVGVINGEMLDLQALIRKIEGGGSPRDAALAKTNSMEVAYTEELLSWKSLRSVEAKIDSRVLTFCYTNWLVTYQLYIQNTMHYGSAEMEVNQNKTTSLKILNVQCHEKCLANNIAELAKYLRDTENTEITCVALHEAGVENFNYDSFQDKYVAINIDELIDETNDSIKLIYSKIAAENFEAKILVRFTNGNYYQVLFDAFLIRPKAESAEEVHSASVPYGWSGEFRLNLVDKVCHSAYNADDLVSTIDRLVVLIIHIHGSFWVVEVRKKILSSNLTFLAAVEKKMNSRWILTTKHKSELDVEAKQYYAYVDKFPSNVANIGQLKISTKNGMLHMTQFVPYADGDNFQLTAPGVDFAIDHQFENLAVAFEGDEFMLHLLDWRPFYFSNVVLGAADVSATYFEPTVLSLHLLVVNDGILVEEPYPVVKIWKYHTKLDCSPNIDDLSNWNGQIVMERKGTWDYNFGNLLGESARTQFFLSTNPNEMQSWRRFIVTDDFVTNYKLTGDLASTQPLFWIWPNSNEPYRIMMKVKSIDEITRTITFDREQTSFVCGKKNSEIKMDHWTSYIRDNYQQHKFGINRSSEPSIADGKAWVEIRFDEIRFSHSSFNGGDDPMQIPYK